MSIRVLELRGSPFDMGFAHGRAFRDDIRHYAEERVELAGDASWSGRSASRSEVLALAEACVDEHRAYAPALLDELSGMAAATGLSLAELVVVGGFTDFIDTIYNTGATATRAPAPAAADDCTAFLVPDARGEGGKGFFGQTWDMHASSADQVIMLRGRPEDAPGFLVFTTVGCVGMIGMNDAGVAVGVNNLLGADGGVGVTWPFVIRKMLMQESVDDALACLLDARLAGAHNYLLFDRSGRGYNVEAMSTRHRVEALGDEPLVHTNHCLVEATREVERPREAPSQSSSEARLEQAAELLASGPLGAEALQALTRDERAICVRPNPPRDVATCGAAIMRPATLDFWAVQGLPSENEYQHFSLA